MDIGDRKTVSLKKASELLGVNTRTLYNWMEDGKIEYVLTAGGMSRRIFVDTLWKPAVKNEFKGQNWKDRKK